MSNPGEHFEELASLYALGLLDAAGRRELFDAADRHPEIEALLREMDETAALLAHDAPGVTPPPELKRAIMRRLPAAPKSKVIPIFSYLLPYAIAACLMFYVVIQSQIQSQRATELNFKIAAQDAKIEKLTASNALKDMRLATLDAKDAAYAAAKITVAWDPNRTRGVVSMQGLPAAPAGSDYQLWILDPGAPAPISAGVLNGARSFDVASVSTTRPGFAISLEPAGGRPEPTGPILFAVAPGPL